MILKFKATAAFFAIAAIGITSAQAADSSSSGGSHRLGGGIHYWKTISNLKDNYKDIDDNGISYVASYQYVYGWVKGEVDAEIFPKNFRGSDKVSIAPEAFLLLGGVLYAGPGVGITYTDDQSLDKKWSDPYGMLRAGVDIPLFDLLHIDIHANYQFTKWSDWDQFDTDTITLGAQARIAF